MKGNRLNSRVELVGRLRLWRRVGRKETLMKRSLFVIILCAGVTLGISIGLRQSLGLFLTPISLDLGLGREVFALGVGLMNLVWGVLAPFAGALSAVLLIVTLVLAIAFRRVLAFNRGFHDVG